MVAQIIKARFWHCPERDVSGPAVGAVGYHLAKPLSSRSNAMRRSMQRWLKTEYPKIKKMAQMQGVRTFILETGGHALLDYHAGRTWGKKGETLRRRDDRSQARHRVLISAITSKGHMRFMIKESGGVNADVFIEFLKRLLIGAKRKIFLIVDRGPAHRAKKTKAFVETLGGQLMLFFLPPYSPDRNPDELVWKHLKADTVGRMATTSKVDFKEKVVASMRSLQKRPDKISTFYHKPSLRYAT